MSQKITVKVEPDEDEEEELTFGRVLLRIIVWGLILVIFAGALMTGFLGEGFLADLMSGTEQTSSGDGGSGGKPNTEGGTAPTSAPAPSGDTGPSTQPTAAVILQPTPLPTFTPWVYPAPMQPAPPVETTCPHIEGEIVKVEIHGSGLRPDCFTIYPWQRIRLVSLLNVPVLVTLEDSSLQLAAGASSEFSEPIGTLLTPGAHTLRADPYGTVEVWLVAQ